jgi:metallo-beta-lactamase family protein
VDEFSLAFHGAAGTVTGSKSLLTAGRARVLVDCGMFQGLKRLRLLNWERPLFDPASVGSIVLTHAHIDHSGVLPRLGRDGFEGRVHAVPATCELAPVLLHDSAKLQEEDAAYANRKGFSKHKPALPLYTTRDVERALKSLVRMAYGQWHPLGDGVEARLHNAGHILGSAFAEVRVQRPGGPRTIVFSGDLGRYGVPLHRDPSPLPACDVLVVESTYGNRKHDPTPMIDRIREPFRRTLQRGGTILIPSFAVARVQLVTLMLRELQEAGAIAEVPIHIDSPMAVKVTEIYRRHVHSGELDEALSDDEWRRLFPREVRFHSTVQESKALNDLPGPRIIIASSGMLTGGRVLHHLERLAPDARNLIVLVGYQAEGTRGRALLDGLKELKMHGQMVPVRAELLTLAGLSAHADADELMRWVATAPSPPKHVYVTHGEQEAAAALAERIRRYNGAAVHVPRLHERFDLERSER